MSICGDDQLGLGIVDAAAQRLGAEARENHRMRCADASTGEHRDDRFRNHRQVDRDAIPCADAELGKAVSCLGHFALQIAIRQVAAIARFAFEPNGHLIAVAVLDMPVDAVIGHIELATHEPTREGGIRPVQHLREVGLPRQCSGLVSPEGEPIGRGLGEQRRLGYCGRRELGRRRERAGLMHQVFELAHDAPFEESDATGWTTVTA